MKQTSAAGDQPTASPAWIPNGPSPADNPHMTDDFATLLVQVVGRDEPCRRYCRIPGVGPVTALTIRAALDDPRRFVKSKTVGAHFGLTPRRIQTGDSIDIEGHISKRGDGEVRDRSGCGEHDILPAPSPSGARVRVIACVAPRSRRRHVRPHGMRG